MPTWKNNDNIGTIQSSPIFPAEFLTDSQGIDLLVNHQFNFWMASWGIVWLLMCNLHQEQVRWSWLDSLPWDGWY